MTGQELIPNRQVAADLYISVRMVEFHRLRIVEKLEVRSAAYCSARASARRRAR
jgi:DNA-binding CsgD family transcriptional regulator